MLSLSVLKYELYSHLFRSLSFVTIFYSSQYPGLALVLLCFSSIYHMISKQWQQSIKTGLCATTQVTSCEAGPAQKVLKSQLPLPIRGLFSLLLDITLLARGETGNTAGSRWLGAVKSFLFHISLSFLF
jgi:hypothetical protein